VRTPQSGRKQFAAELDALLTPRARLPEKDELRRLGYHAWSSADEGQLGRALIEAAATGDVVTAPVMAHVHGVIHPRCSMPLPG
jgi:hypothetical protein